MKDLREDLEKIVNLSHCKFCDGKGIDGECPEDKELAIEAILSLFKQQMKGLVPKKKDSNPIKNMMMAGNPQNSRFMEDISKIDGFNQAIDQILNNIESL